jgi:acyl transferase domain-containing protein
LSSGFTVPNSSAQQELIRTALASARIDPGKVSCIETHGTGTSLGDPIEVAALGAVFCQGRSKKQPVVISSVKTNIGHLESAAGIALLIKTVLCLKHKEIVPHLHFNQPNPGQP